VLLGHLGKIGLALGMEAQHESFLVRYVPAQGLNKVLEQCQIGLHADSTLTAEVRSRSCVKIARRTQRRWQ
jgi:hypothetical protein